MNSLIVTLIVMLCLAYQTACNTLTNVHEQSTVVSAMLAEPYLAALLSLVLLIATLI